MLIKIRNISATVALMGLILMPNVSSSGNAEPAIQFESNIVLEAKNTLSLTSEVSSYSVSQVLEKAYELDAKLPKGEPFYLVLKSPGGSIFAGLELIEGLKGLGRPVHTITIFSASMAFHLIQQLNHRYMVKNGTLMSHKAKATLRGEIPGNLESRLKWLKKVIETMDKQVVKRTKGKHTFESYRKLYADEYWSTGFEENFKNGFIDAVVSVKCGKSLQGKRKIVEKNSLKTLKLKLITVH